MNGFPQIIKNQSKSRTRKYFFFYQLLGTSTPPEWKKL